MSFVAMDLARAASQTIGQRKELWALPVLASCCSLVIWATAWYFVLDGWLTLGIRSKWTLLLAPAWFLAAFSHAYFQVALAHGLTGDDPESRMDEALGFAWQHKAAIAWWTLINGAARMSLTFGGRHAGVLPGLSWLGGMAWATATFPVPVLLAQGCLTGKALRVSAEVVHRHLTDSAVGLGGLWILFRAVQGMVAGLGTTAVWLLVMSQSPVMGVGVGLLAGILILALETGQQALTVAFAYELLAKDKAEASASQQLGNPGGAIVHG